MTAGRTKLRHLAGGLWGLVQVAPGLPGDALLNDVVIVLFGVDLAILVSPWI